MSTAKKKPAITTKRLTELVSAKFSPPEYGCLFNVGDGTGFRQYRWADAIAMGLWPSRGVDLHGIEIKASRADWKKELSQPEKADAICKFCDRWWIVAGDASIVLLSELPSTWGLMVPAGSGLKVVVDAPKLTPVPITKMMLAGIFRRACEQQREPTAMKLEFERGLNEGEKRGENRADYELQKLRRLFESVKKFAATSGVVIDEYSGDEIGRAVRTVMNGEHLPGLSKLHGIRAVAKSIIGQIDRELGPEPEASA